MINKNCIIYNRFQVLIFIVEKIDQSFIDEYVMEILYNIESNNIIKYGD